jgi:hypothetical protein
MDEYGLHEKEVKRTVTGFELDDEGHWRAKLECRHYQHVRHQPPLRVREWTLTEEGRASRIGQPLECKKYDEGQPADF